MLKYATDDDAPRPIFPKRDEDDGESKSDANSSPPEHPPQSYSCCCHLFSLFTSSVDSREKAPLLKPDNTPKSKKPTQRRATVGDLVEQLLKDIGPMQIEHNQAVKQKCKEKIEQYKEETMQHETEINNEASRIIKRTVDQADHVVIHNNEDGRATLIAFPVEENWYVVKRGSLDGDESVRAGTTRALENELKILAGLRTKTCDNIINIINKPEQGIEPFIVMPYYPHTLYDLRTQEIGQISLDNLVDILWQLADALEFIRKKKIVHNDIKAENVLIGYDMCPKLADFGQARELANSKQDDFLGTPGQQSPEMIDSTTATDCQSDHWGFFALIFAMILGVDLISDKVKQTMIVMCIECRYYDHSDRGRDNPYQKYIQMQQDDIDKRLKEVKKKHQKIAGIFRKCFTLTREERPAPEDVLNILEQTLEKKGYDEFPIESLFLKEEQNKKTNSCTNSNEPYTPADTIVI